jgi:hypothetical protein
MFEHLTRVGERRALAFRLDPENPVLMNIFSCDPEIVGRFCRAIAAIARISDMHCDDRKAAEN